MSTDRKFFTNEPDETLLNRFQSTFAHVQYLDILVGYFRTSGFHLLYESLADSHPGGAKRGPAGV